MVELFVEHDLFRAHIPESSVPRPAVTRFTIAFTPLTETGQFDILTILAQGSNASITKGRKRCRIILPD